MKNILEVVNICCERSQYCLFKQLNFSVESGQLLMIKGRNGAGKSSLLRIISGLLETDIGDIYWQGKSVKKDRARFLAQLLYIGHLNGLKNNLNVNQNINYLVSLSEQTKAFSLAELLQLFNLEKLADRFIQQLSAGQARRVALTRLYFSSAKLWLLDEPFTSLDRDMISVIEQLIEQHITAGGVVLMASHHSINLSDKTKLKVLELTT